MKESPLCSYYVVLVGSDLLGGSLLLVSIFPTPDPSTLKAFQEETRVRLRSKEASLIPITTTNYNYYL